MPSSRIRENEGFTVLGYERIKMSVEFSGNRRWNGEPPDPRSRLRLLLKGDLVEVDN